VSEPNAPINAAVVAGQLAEQLELQGQEYAIGGAVALGYWGVPRGTVGVDLADVEQFLRTQGAHFDRRWVREQLAAMYGARDPRLSQWDDLVREIPAD
jgi:hypothetical protein